MKTQSTLELSDIKAIAAAAEAEATAASLRAQGQTVYEIGQIAPRGSGAPVEVG